MKREAAPKDSAKDIQLLFARAGMSGAKYREFPRHDAVAADAGGDASGEAADSSSAVTAAVSLNPASPATAAATPSPQPQRETSAAAASYASLEKVFAGRASASEAGQGIRSGLRLALLSLAGGVGKTTLAVTLARVLSGMRRQVIVADCAAYPSVAHHLGSQSQRLGPLRFFFAPSLSAPMPIAVFEISSGHSPAPSSTPSSTPSSAEDLQDLVEQVVGGETTMLLDLPTLQAATPGRLLANASHALVPVTPDMHSVAGVAHLQALLAASGEAGDGPTAHYVINRFDDSRPLHREVRSRLHELLGASLLPIVIHDDHAIEEAAAQGMTVVDAFPGSSVVHEFAALAEWACSLSPNFLRPRKEGAA